ncbi:MAG: isoleucine--tRNA ligase [Coxiellaceae bacterium]|jgi:isoleucyl-tRNA synthetase|nr:isoleucine--tRNA ligase [Coxiellaceae bacterium]
MTTYPVNLPKTNFPMKADLPKREPKILEFWQSINLYHSFANPKNSCGKFILHDGPPYANGDIHLGHAFNKIIKDIINKSKLFAGYSVPYVPGWDCHGLPIEINVEKKIGKAGVKVSVEEFIAKCRTYATEQIQLQKQSFKRLGIIGDWEHPYLTMDFKYEADVVRALMQIVAAGHVMRGYKAVHWCIACASALAEAEVEYKNKTSPAIDVKFRIVHSEKFKVTNLSIPIWTTTPWTLPANEGVAVHPKLKYALVQCITLNGYFIILEDLLTTAMQRYGESNYKVEKIFQGSELAGLMTQHPFLDNKEVPIILSEHVTTDVGTGAVHIAPAHGQEDYKIGVQYKLPINNPVGNDGKFLASTKFFAGENVFDANPHVINVVREHSNLIHEETLQHSYPHCWRHKTPLIFRATEQWFVSMDNISETTNSLRQEALGVIKKVNWLPTSGENSMQNMLELRPDWCISRQRYWGIPITLFVHKETGKIHPEMSRFVNDIIAPKIEKLSFSYWHSVEPISFLKEHAKNNTDAENYLKVNDTLDVWFNSGVSHFCVSKERGELNFPAEVYVEGSDQYRGWFQSSLLTALTLYNQAPYKTVITHGFCVDAKGHKMSKSLGNVINPQAVVNKYGADILRLWVGTTYLHDDLTASDEIFARVIDVYRLLRNTVRFILGNLFDFNPERDLVQPDQMLSLDRWAVSEILNLAKSNLEYYNAYQFYTACNNLQVMLTNNISSFYFSIIKDRLYTMAVTSLGRRSAQSALFHILEILVRLIAPILSFTAEEIWQEMRANNITNRVESAFMARWDECVKENYFNLSHDLITASDWREIQYFRAEVNKELEKLRINSIIGSSLAADIILYADDKILSLLKKLKDDLRFILITSSAEIKNISSAPESAINTAITGLKLVASRSPHKKCSRCWHYRDDVGSNKDHPELCLRCEENLFGKGETRYCA